MEYNPHMSELETERFVELLQVSKCYLEYGSGMSTLKAVELDIPKIFSVESSQLWIDGIKSKIEDMEYDGNCILIKTDIGPVGKWGTPSFDFKWKNYWQYPLAIWDYIKNDDASPDLILIDGRFRIACFLACFLYADKGTRILFHDYVNRDCYHSIANLIKPELIIDSMAEFIVSNYHNTEEVWRNLIVAITDHR